MPPDSYWRDTGEWPPWRKQLKTIDDPFVEETFTYRNAEGKRVSSRVVIGHPRPVPKGFGDSWYCPVIIEGWYVGIRPILSVGPVGALVNASSAVGAFLKEVVWVVPEKRPGRKKQRGTAKTTTKRRSRKPNMKPTRTAP